MRETYKGFAILQNKYWYKGCTTNKRYLILRPDQELSLTTEPHCRADTIKEARIHVDDFVNYVQEQERLNNARTQ